ncbi:MAG: hypothetical protein H0W47_13905 [Polaromonas sp.]|uniref:hypothetical protein n=1 Tax=Polaromonas sp. TaxID=1869339 RepID=UPI0018567CAF|nr:hypothetical protein [Polaromonas sp.]MBA3594870.1 hypothetical protein [Polaromonas sp.]
MFIASLVMTLVVGGADGIKESIGGLLLQFIGTIYWGNRIRSKPSLFVRFWVNNDSPEWERLCFGGIALGALIAGQLFVFSELLH